MSFVITAPAELLVAATDLATIGSTIGAVNATVAASTTAVLAPGADAVSAAMAALFNVHGQEYQAVSLQTAAFHDQFVHTLNAAAGTYASADATSASLIQNVLTVVNAPTQTLFGRSLIGMAPTAPREPGQTAATAAY